MSDTNTRYMFDTKLIMDDIEKVIQKGLNQILSNYMDRFILLEQTHRQLMKLPSVSMELGDSPSNNICSDNVITRLENMENKYDTMITLFDNLLSKFNSLNDNIINIKNCNNNTIISDSEEVKIKTEVFLLEEELSNESVIVREILKNYDKELQESQEDEAIQEQETHHEESVDEEEVVEQQECDEVQQSDENQESDEDQESEQDKEFEQDKVSHENQESEEQVVDSVETDTKEEESQEEEVEDDASVETETKEEHEEASVETETKDEEPDDEELFEIEIDDKTYCTNNEENGFIWELTDDGEQGDKVGYLKDGEPFFYADEN